MGVVQLYNTTDPTSLVEELEEELHDVAGCLLEMKLIHEQKHKSACMPHGARAQAATHPPAEDGHSAVARDTTGGGALGMVEVDPRPLGRRPTHHLNALGP